MVEVVVEVVVVFFSLFRPGAYHYITHKSFSLLMLMLMLLLLLLYFTRAEPNPAISKREYEQLRRAMRSWPTLNSFKQMLIFQFETDDMREVSSLLEGQRE